ncbi:hypothetical protein AVEN_223043-1, partial [Araneus ventricosus]
KCREEATRIGLSQPGWSFTTPPPPITFPDGNDNVENTTSLISNTDGMKALEAELCYAEQQSSASPIDAILLKKMAKLCSKLPNF